MSDGIWHGGDLAQARALFPDAPEPWVDLSTGINPIPYPLPPVPLSLWQRLPGQQEEAALLAAARTAYGVPPDAGIVAAPGTQILIELLPKLLGQGAGRRARPDLCGARGGLAQGGRARAGGDAAGRSRPGAHPRAGQPQQPRWPHRLARRAGSLGGAAGGARWLADRGRGLLRFFARSQPDPDPAGAHHRAALLWQNLWAGRAAPGFCGRRCRRGRPPARGDGPLGGGGPRARRSGPMRCRTGPGSHRQRKHGRPMRPGSMRCWRLMVSSSAAPACTACWLARRPPPCSAISAGTGFTSAAFSISPLICALAFPPMQRNGDDWRRRCKPSPEQPPWIASQQHAPDAGTSPASPANLCVNSKERNETTCPPCRPKTT